MVFELLGTGKESARTAKELCCQLGIDKKDWRVVTKAIERERREGKPICASSSSDYPGYYKPANREELTRYANRLHMRAGEILKTRRALLKALEEMEV